MKLFILLFGICCLLQVQALSVSKDTYQQLFNEQLKEALEEAEQPGLLQRLFPGLEEYGSVRRKDWNEPRKVSQVLPTFISKELGLAFDRNFRRGSHTRL